MCRSEQKSWCISSSAAVMLSQEEPESAERPPYIVQEAWQQSIEARGIVNNLLRRNKRRTFGKLLFLFTRVYHHYRCLCQFPVWRRHSVMFYLYYLQDCWRSQGLIVDYQFCVGDFTWLENQALEKRVLSIHLWAEVWACDLTGNLLMILQHADIPQTYEETLGIQTNTVYWPTKVNYQGLIQD